MNNNSKQKTTYAAEYERSIHPLTREAFWAEQAKDISWSSFPQTILFDEAPFYHWFPDGELNVCYNCLDRHVEDDNDKGRSKLAVIWESYYLNQTVKVTFGELHAIVNEMAFILQKHSIGKGDRVIIYLPMIPEGIYSMLSCCRIGAIHSVVFGGFAADELAERISDAQPKMIITASCGIEPKRVIPYYPIVKKAIQLSKVYNVKVLLFQREGAFVVDRKDIDSMTYIYTDEVSPLRNRSKPIYVKPEKLKGNDTFFILYTSGTSGLPKGIVRDCASVVSINYTMKAIMNVSKGDVVFSTSDYGWIVGHVFIVYGPLLKGATTTIFEGKPVNTPNSGKCWEIIQKHKVKAFYTSPTALRTIKREDPSYALMHQYDLSSLESVHLSGERCDPETHTWTKNGLSSIKLLNDQWWQTESGWPICCNNQLIYQFTIPPGVAGPPLMGYVITVLDEDYQKELPNTQTGRLCIKLPLPPGFMKTLFNNDQSFLQRYITKDYQYYISGDIGFKDANGFVCVLGRDDDMIKIAGHRLSTGKIEEILMKVPLVVEAAVVSKRDELKGEVPVAFIVCEKGKSINETALMQEANSKVIDSIGRICALNAVFICSKLPKTRSGKIIRKILNQIVNKDPLFIPPTIEDKDSIQDVMSSMSKSKL